MKFEQIYEKDEFGIIKQKEKKSFLYNQDYLGERYVIIKDKCINMSYLRLGFLLGNISGKINSLLDFGCGSGYFLEVASDCIENTYNYDIIDNNFSHSQKLDYEDIFSKKFDVVTFFDSLEHVEDPYTLIKKIDTKYIHISVPWCHIQERGKDWFMNWKHRRHDEHLYHFNLDSLIRFFEYFGYKLIKYSNIEDTIRKSDEENNILSCIFIKKEKIQ